MINVFFTCSYISDGFIQAQALLEHKGRIISRQIAGAAELSLFSGNNQQIQHILDQTIDSDDLVFASIYNLQGELVAESVSAQYQADGLADYHYYHQVIVSQSINTSDIFSPDQVDEPKIRVMGWVHVYLSKDALETSKNIIIGDAIIFFALAFAVTLILAGIISRRITKPIFILMEHLHRAETGHLGELIEATDSNEVGAVQRGFNRMTQALAANQKHLNERIQQATKQLQEAIADLEMKNTELAAARDEAQNANRTKSQFLVNMSHEIRTPLNGIKGFINLMMKSDMTSPQKRYAEIILKSTNDLTSIIEEILDLSKLESGKLQIVEEDFDLYEVIEQTRDILFVNVIKKNIDLILIIYSDIPRLVKGDKLHLKQALLNLMGNAIKFTDQGQVVVRVQLEGKTDNQAEVLITVEDTGIGINEQDQDELFTAFRQIDSTSNRRYSGTGLGLVISKNLVNLMGGDITMESHYGKGSTFSIRLPFQIVDLPLNRRPVPGLFALVFASKAICLQEIKSLYDRADVTTVGNLINPEQPADVAKTCIQQNRHLIDMIVFDLRHMKFNLDELVNIQQFGELRVIIMHYDQSMLPDVDFDHYEFISIITTSAQLRASLNTSPRINSPAIETDPQLISLDSKRVLLVDDNPINLALAGELIRLWGHQVIETEHALDAFTYYQQQDFDLIVLDIQMPDIDGIDLLKMMRIEKPDDPAPIVALTANIMQGETKRLIKLGFDYYLNKPIDEEKLKAILDGNQLAVDRLTVLEQTSKLDRLSSIDLAKSLSLLADNQSLLKHTLETLIQEIPTYQEQLRSALEPFDKNKILLVIHKIQGVTCYISLPKMRQQVIEVGELMAQNRQVNADLKIRAIIEELSCIQSTVEAEISRLGTIDNARNPNGQSQAGFEH